MTEALETEAEANTRRRAQVRKSLSRRNRAEKRFKMLGLGSVLAAMAFVAVLFGNILTNGLPAFWQFNIDAEVYFDPEIINVPEVPVQQAGQSDADFRAEMLGWQRRLAMVNWNRILVSSVEGALAEAETADGAGTVTEIDTRSAQSIIDSGARFVLRDMVLADPTIIGERREMQLLLSADGDNWAKGKLSRDLPDDRQQLSRAARDAIDLLTEEGIVHRAFAWHIFTNVDSRSSPASAGLAGAFVGSFYMMLVVILLAVPIGVSSAIYLEEFAPKNPFTDLIEVNINNLAAVPSIVFGLLGAAVFINIFHLPLSAPLVGGLVLTLMTLPTIIIATRSALRAVPPSLRQAALGIGASKTQMVFHHVLPVTYPGILTASILGVAQALGETAPLLLIGMNAFVANVPATPMDQSAALPVQIYLWQGNENRNFFEERTFAAIIVLLALMILLNALAIWLRGRLERKA
ncbi:phosphate ABC transporter permease PstA [Rhodobacter sp. NTK016B]|uniref:phosphate ABC transporter permease PstA n=1 Tax=Rhodobacter sp. NTK016B TaxID=2759676 RepID=UPI001A8F8677|nr:phosphate ABC transporter permease PstA [Rhodobacter sp. NTK016B]MBN8290471.1 phosphate ABC transporter permease PstA [Rhodobacter sp. NTK016B]